MPTPLQNLTSIFNNRVFRIPDYQRGYAWGQSQLEDFWEDLHLIGGQRNHYTGQLTLERVPEASWKRWNEDTWLIDGKSFSPYYVVDGQQRLTTAIILIKCLLERIPDGGRIAFADKREHRQKFLVQEFEISKAYLLGYERDNPSYDFLKSQILNDHPDRYDGVETTYTANLAAAQSFFRDKLKNSSLQDLEAIFRTITQKFLFNVYELEEELDVFVVFETMNNRGKPLSQLELLKNRIIYLSTLFPEPTKDADRNALRRNVNEAWKTVYEHLGREKNEPLNDDEFLRAHWIIFFKYARDEAGQFARFLLGSHFTAQHVSSGDLPIAELQRYVSSIQASVRKWSAIHFPNRAEALAPEIVTQLEKLDRLGRGAFEPLLMAAMQIAANDPNLSKLTAAAERFIFVVSRLCQRRSDTGDSEFYRLAGQLYRGEKTLAEAVSMVESQTAFYFSAEKAITSMRDLFLRYSGFYSWEGLRYFLFEYEQHLRENAGMQAVRLNWDVLRSTKKDHVTVEHIFPISPHSGEWPSFELLSEGERASLRNSLGNLLALSQQRNSKFSNRSFSEKKQSRQGTTGYFNGSYSEIDVAKHDDWTPATVLERGLKMLQFLEQRWSVSLGSRTEKIRLLNLDFVEPTET